MSDLDDKLKKVWIDDNVGGWTRLTDEAIAQIKQAFADAGYVQNTYTIRPRPNVFNVLPEVMTGQEFYDRFLKHMGAIKPTAITRADALEAAKRAARLDT